MTPKISIILHNIRSAYNVGSIFRTADAAGIDKIYICGYTPAPTTNKIEHQSSAEKIKKTSLGAEKNIPWEQHKQTWRLLEKLRKENIHIVALEISAKAIDYRKYEPKFPLVLLVGNEVNGLSPKILENVNDIVQIPMNGKKESLNVSVAAGIMLYKLIENAITN